MTYIVILLYLLIISSGSVFACTYFNKKYEEVLPISCSAIVVFSFLLGMCTLLKISTILIIVISLALYVLSIIKIVKEKNYKEVLGRIFTPGFLVYIVLAFVFLFALKGKLMDNFDEFSHWGDVVRAMTSIDDFASNKASHSIFRTYPPGMSLFQYFLQKLNTLLTGEVFSEWMLYFAYYTFAISFIIPICSSFSYKRIIAPATMMAVIFLVPSCFYLNAYTSIYIDQFLSFLLCGGLIQLLWNKNHDVFFDITMYLIMSMLVLSKDVGLLFSALLGVGFVVTKVIDSNEKILSKNNIIVILITLVAVFAPKLLWNLNCSINDAEGLFTGKIDLVNFIKVVLGRDDTYRTKVFKNYITHFVTGGYVPGGLGIEINYACLTLITITALCIITRIAIRKCFVNKKNAFTAEFVMLISLITFIFGMCIVYMYKFSEDEALGLASLQRYINIVYLASWFYISASVVKIADEIINNEKMICAILVCFMALCAPLELIFPFLNRSYVRMSNEFRESYNDIINKTLKYVDEDDRVYFISQNSEGTDRIVYRYAIRPAYAKNDFWTLGESRYEGDPYSLDISVNEWIEDLKENYDYVTIFTLNDNFCRDFSSAFENDDHIAENCIYKVNKETGLLSLCE
ncbi:MAG: hypothetical protein Q4E33_01400 [Erysipelotrichaceae bacterium]|nr:hypothetical protein [Erysipelotrichaceae bacterium]